MKLIISLLIVSFLVTSCDLFKRNHSSNFSKRKYLKGHFWNHKENLRSKTTDLYLENEIAELDNEVESNTYELNHSPSKSIATNDKEEELQSCTLIEEQRSNDRIADKFEENYEVEEIDKTTDTIPRSAQMEEKEIQKKKSRVYFWESFFIGLTISSVGLGVIGLITYFVLYLLDISVKWLLITSLSMTGVGIILAIILLILMAIGMSRPLPLRLDQQYGSTGKE